MNTTELLEKLALIWVQGQDLSKASPEDVLNMYHDAHDKIKEANSANSSDSKKQQQVYY